MDGGYWDAGNNFSGCEVHAPVREKCEIRVLISEANNFLASRANTNKGIEAFCASEGFEPRLYHVPLNAFGYNLCADLRECGEESA